MSNYIDVQRITINIDKYLRYITLFNSFENYHKVSWRYIAMTVIIENYHKVNWRYIAMTVIIENYHKVNWRYTVIIENYHKVSWRNYHEVNWRAIISDNVNYRYLVYLKNISINKIFVFAIISWYYVNWHIYRI